ncbi:MAG: DUF1592 domain-containing protein [Myxococcaceae bacterium]
MFDARASLTPLVLTGLLSASGCVGSATSEREGADTFVPGQASAPVFRCDEAATPAELPLPRLSRSELESTLQDAVMRANPDEGQAIWQGSAATFARYPADLRTPAPGDLRGGYARGDQAIQQAQIDTGYDTAVELARGLTSNATRIRRMLGTCATDASTTNDRMCLENFVKGWGARTLRQPLRAEDVTFYADIAGTTPVAAAAVADVVAAVLTAPETLYRIEHGADDAQARAPLSAYELAARLSYQFWQAPPDDALWEAATSGDLLKDDVYDAQLNRILASPKVRGSLDPFVTEWLRLSELPPLDALNADPVFKAFSGTQLPPSTGRASMVDDVLQSAFSTLSGGGSVSDFLKDRHSYAEDDFLAGIYGVPAWEGTGPAPELTSSKRAGLITRAAMLATGTATTRPIHKGYLVRNALLCQKVGAPPPNVSTEPPGPTEGLTTREAVTQLTSGVVCGGCHFTTINPPGFLSEGFDALGRERTEERLFDAQGNLAAALPISTASVPAVHSSDTRELADAVELTQVIDESQLFHSCVARQYFRFSARRVEVPAADGCLLSNLETAARSGAPLREVLKRVALDSTFKTRRFP